MRGNHLRDIDGVAWDGFLWLWEQIGDHASGEHSRRMRRMATLGKRRWA